VGIGDILKILHILLNMWLIGGDPVQGCKYRLKKEQLRAGTG
jgi:hypothetical protein